MKRQTKLAAFFLTNILMVEFLLLACVESNHTIVITPTNPTSQTLFSVSLDPRKDAPTTFSAIDWSQEDKMTIQGLLIEKYPVFIGETDSGKVFPFYMDNSVVSGTIPIISPDGNYLGFQTNGKIYVVLMSTMRSGQYIIYRENLVTIFDFPNRCDLAWSPDSEHLASVCLAVDGINISVMEPKSNERRDVFQYTEKHIREIEGVSWSLDANNLAFSLRFTYDEGGEKVSQADMFVYHLGTNSLFRITSSSHSDEQSPDWFPRTEILTFTSYPDTGVESRSARLIFSTLDGKCVQQIPDIAGIVSPTWSPDGSHMAYISNWESIEVMETSKFVPHDFLTPEGLCKVAK